MYHTERELLFPSTFDNAANIVQINSGHNWIGFPSAAVCKGLLYFGRPQTSNRGPNMRNRNSDILLRDLVALVHNCGITGA